MKNEECIPALNDFQITLSMSVSDRTYKKALSFQFPSLDVVLFNIYQLVFSTQQMSPWSL